MQIRDRIKELRRVPASELIPNPKNWRRHPVAQQDALRGVLAEVGYADALIARETPEGLMLVDGHLRAETTPDSSVPVLVLDIDEDEADLMLATLDPLAAMAGRDEERLSELLATATSTIPSAVPARPSSQPNVWAGGAMRWRSSRGTATSRSSGGKITPGRRR